MRILSGFDYAGDAFFGIFVKLQQLQIAHFDHIFSTEVDTDSRQRGFQKQGNQIPIGMSKSP